MLEQKRDSLEDCQKKLNYHHLSQIAFESEKDKQEIYRRGMQKFESGQVSEEALFLGEKWRGKIESAYIPKVSVRFVNPSVGYGLFLEEEIKPGFYVGEYTGVVRRNDRRYFEPLNGYCYTYPVPDEIGRPFVTDATQGCLTRFINHSQVPNLRPVHVFYDGFYHLIFLSLRDIAKGERLFFNYGSSYWQVRDKPLDL